MSPDQTKQTKRHVIVQKKKRERALCNGDDFDRRYESAVKSYQNYMEGINLVLKEKERNILKILHKRSSPLWFQELTDEQCLTCDLMLDAIGDDLDERTFHRSKDLLRKLGVYPLCQDRIMRTALILCNRNDISFLWILLELYYIRRPGKVESNREASYSINERLLLSSIAHLDMMTTLRGLDKILPPKKRSSFLPEPAGEKANGKSTQPKTRVSPYTERLMVNIHTGYTVPVKVQPHRDDFLGRYSQYANPEYTIRNEKSRWFTRSGGSGRNLFSSNGSCFTSEDATELCTESESIQSANKIVRSLLDENIRNMIARIECGQMLCPKHHELDEGCSTVLQDLQRTSPARDALMESVRCQLAQWNEQELLSDGRRQVESLLKRVVDEAVTLAILEPVDNCPECWQRFDMQQTLQKQQNCACATSNETATVPPKPIQEPGQTYFKFSDTDFKNMAIPFEFDYGKIFDDDEKQKKLLACPIKRAIKLALRVEDDAGNENIDQVIEKFMKKAWCEEQRCEKERRSNERKKMEPQPLPAATDPLDMDCIDTKDVADLQNLLKSALRKLANRPMYMLATFPDAHKLPILVAWMRQRYGVPVHPQERATALLESKHFWDTLVPRATTIRWPSRKSTGLKCTVNWDYKAKLEAMVGKLMHTFHRSFKNVQVQEGRLWWTSMVASHAGPDRFRRTFAAYFPNCEPMMVPSVHPWRSHEYRAMPSGTRSDAGIRF